MLTKQKILHKAKKQEKITTNEFVNEFGVSRQYVNSLISDLVDDGSLLKAGSTRNAFYILTEKADELEGVLPNSYVKTYINENLEEHTILNDIEEKFILYKTLKENTKSIFTYAFLEMLNNAIEHSETDTIKVIVRLKEEMLYFEVNDFGIGIFRNIMQKRNLKNELEATQDLLKGKTTTAPKLHSGEGIFFTSKISDNFILDSYGQQLIIDNKKDDVFIKKTKGQKQGTKVVFEINVHTEKHLRDIFDEYTNQSDNSDYGFDKTEIRIKLYTIGDIHISRSQARRVLSGLEKFEIIVMDYSDVPMVGQAFADEIYRVFKNKYPNIEIRNEHMNESVQFMINRAIKESHR